MPTIRCIELEACGPDDPHGLRTATILSAYFRVEAVRALRRMLWRRLTIAAVAWLVISLTTSLLSRGETVAGLAMLGAVASGVAVPEWIAVKRLSDLLANFPWSMRSVRAADR